MAQLTANEMQSLLSAVQRIHACGNATSFGQTVVEAMTKVIRSDRADIQIYQNPPVSFETLYRSHPLPGDEEREEFFLSHILEHPIVDHFVRTGDDGPLLLTDLISIHEWRQTEMYARCSREPRDDFLLCLSIAIDHEEEMSISFDRRRSDFSERDRLILRLAGDHIAQAWRNIQYVDGLQKQISLLERGLEPRGAGLLMVEGNDRIRAASHRAVSLLGRYFPDWSGMRLPEAVIQWLVANHQRSSGVQWRDGNRCPLRIVGANGSLTVNARPGENGQAVVLQLREEAPETEAHQLESLGLTPRQAQTLYWLTHGKTNPEIAVILKVSPRTVAKFVETLFVRLDVNNRLAAVLIAQDALGGCGAVSS